MASKVIGKIGKRGPLPPGFVWRRGTAIGAKAYPVRISQQGNGHTVSSNSGVGTGAGGRAAGVEDASHDQDIEVAPWVSRWN